MTTKPRIVLWMVFLLMLVSALGYEVFHVKPSPVDCVKAMNQWNYDVGQLAIADVLKDTKKSDELQRAYDKLVLSASGVCFPPQLIDFVVAANG